MATSNHMQDDWPKATCAVILDGVQDDRGRIALNYCPNKPYALVGARMFCEKHYEEIKENARKQ